MYVQGANVPWGFLTFIGGVHPTQHTYVSHHIHTLLTGLFGALIYGTIEPKLASFRDIYLPKVLLGADTLTEVLGVEYMTLAIPMMLACAGMVAIFESFFGWETSDEGFLRLCASSRN